MKETITDKWLEWFKEFSEALVEMRIEDISRRSYMAGFDAAQQGVQRTALQVRVLNAICYGITAGSLAWLLFGSR